jgi:uncharacterized protein YbjT (DUF2867 family)
MPRISDAPDELGIGAPNRGDFIGENIMRIVVVGASGHIGSRVSRILLEKEFEVVPASPSFGVNTVTGVGLDAALAGADVVVDLSNPPSFEAATATNFFTASTRNLLKAEADAGVGHHVALSVVGSERIPNGFFMAKRKQEAMIKDSAIPYSIVHSTQFFEFFETIARSARNDGDVIFLPDAFFQPIASDDVACAVADVAISTPVNGIVEIAGPEPLRMPEIVQRYLLKRADPRVVSSDIHAPYFGGEIGGASLLPGEAARLGSTTFDVWLRGLI